MKLASLAIAPSADFKTAATALCIGDISLLTWYDFMVEPTAEALVFEQLA